MCRFLLVRSKRKVKPVKLLSQFAKMCEQSRAPDGDWQGDGWGIATQIQNLKLKIKNWKTYKSLKPIWEDMDKFQQFGETDIFIVHARSSGFPDQKGVIDYNQPYIHDSLAFVFNGMIRGVSLSMPLEGKIGAQKIFSLLRSVIPSEGMHHLVRPEVEESMEVRTNIIEALRYVDRLIISNAKKVEGMNIGLVRDDNFYVLCEYERNADYFRIKYYQDDKIALVCSEPIGSYQWRIMIKSEILVI